VSIHICIYICASVSTILLLKKRNCDQSRKRVHVEQMKLGEMDPVKGNDVIHSAVRSPDHHRKLTYHNKTCYVDKCGSLLPDLGVRRPWE
jgi:hypothetical protein